MSDDYLEIQRRNFEAQFGSLSELGYKDKTEAEAESEDEFSGFGSDLSSGDSSQELSDSDEDETTGFEAQPKKTKESKAKSPSVGDMDEIFSKLSKAPSKPSAPAVKVVKVTDTFAPTQSSKADRKLARSGRAPTLQELEEKQRVLAKITKKQQQQAATEDAEHLENDLKLQRLLKESHILAHNMEHSGADLTLKTMDIDAPIGNARRRILEQRIREVSATHSSTNGLPRTLQKMPMNLRKALIKKQEEQARVYEKEAREAGIVLPKLKKGEFRNINQGQGAKLESDRLGFGRKQKSKSRDRGLKIQSVGKSTRNGLRISQHEINRVNKKR